MVSVKAAATGKVSWGPMVSGLGPREQAKIKREQQRCPCTKLVLTQRTVHSKYKSTESKMEIFLATVPG